MIDHLIDRGAELGQYSETTIVGILSFPNVAELSELSERKTRMIHIRPGMRDLYKTNYLLI